MDDFRNSDYLFSFDSLLLFIIVFIIYYTPAIIYIYIFVRMLLVYLFILKPILFFTLYFYG